MKPGVSAGSGQGQLQPPSPSAAAVGGAQITRYARRYVSKLGTNQAVKYINLFLVGAKRKRIQNADLMHKQECIVNVENVRRCGV